MSMKRPAVLLTGAANGIGRATAMALAARGTPLGLIDRDGTALAALVQDLKERGATIADASAIGLARQLLHAQEYWRVKDLRADLVILNDHPALFQNESQRSAGVVNVEPGALLLAIAVDRQCLPLKGVRDHQWQKLFRELVRAVVIRRPRDDGRNFVGPDERADKQIGACL